MAFVPGRELNHAFYTEVVGPLVAPWPHGAALLGWGSEVLGYDTERSTDHGWGPRVTVFVGEDDLATVRGAVDEGLPAVFAGRPVRYGWDRVEARHHVVVVELGSWLRAQLGRDPREGMSTPDWLLTPQQQLLGVVGGTVYHDPEGALSAVRQALVWYPDDVWAWLVACQWHRVAQEEPFTGRTAEVGDDLGSRVVAARLAREVIRLAFLLSRTYWPYTKWLGTAFAELEVGAALGPPLSAALSSDDGDERQGALGEALEIVATLHNDVGLTEPLDPTTRPFHTRPFRVLDADRFATACVARVAEPWLHTLPLVGSVDQFADSTDVLSAPARANRLAAIYGISGGGTAADS